MLNRLIIEKVLSEKKFTVFNFIGLILVIIFSVTILTYYKSYEKGIEDRLIYYEDSILLMNDDSEELISSDLMDFLDIEGYSYAKTSFSTLTATRSGQSISVYYISPVLLDTGVLSYDYSIKKSTVENSLLLHGKTWSSSLDDGIVIDEYTAISTFGYSNVVGNNIIILENEYEIIGIIENSTQREAEFKNCETINDLCFLKDIPSKVYLNFTDDVDIRIDYLIISTNHSTSDEVIDLILNRYNTLSLDYTNYISSKSILVEKEIGDIELFYQFIVVIFSVVATLGVLNQINTNIFTHTSRKKEYEIMFQVGFSKILISKIRMLEGILLGVISVLFSMILSFVICFILLLSNGLLKSFDYGFFVRTYLALFIIVPSFLALINFILGYTYVSLILRKKSNARSDVDAI